MSGALVRYDQARVALYEARTVDDAKNILDKVEALRVYARQTKDAEMEAWVAEIKIRAMQRIGELSAELDSAQGSRTELLPSTGKKLKAATLKDAGISTSAAHRCETIAGIDKAKFEAFIADKTAKGKPVTAAETIKLVTKKAKVSVRQKHVKAGGRVADLVALAASGYRAGALYIDPPWLYSNQSTRASTDNHYDGMTVDELCALPVRNLAAKDAHLHLWTTNGFLFECPRIINAWGFVFKSSFVWVKTSIGIGNYWRNSHEFLLTAVRGDATRFNDRSLKSWMECDRGKHSAKPEQVRHFIERASPGPYLELFARAEAPNWTVWGNEVANRLFDEVVA